MSEELLDEFRAKLDELGELLTEHREHRILPGVRNLRAQADEPGTPADVLARLDRAFWSLMGIPDGLSALYFPKPGGGVDRADTDRLTALRTDLSAVLRQAADRREATA